MAGAGHTDTKLERVHANALAAIKRRWGLPAVAARLALLGVVGAGGALLPYYLGSWWWVCFLIVPPLVFVALYPWARDIDLVSHLVGLDSAGPSSGVAPNRRAEVVRAARRSTPLLPTNPRSVRRFLN
jgi:hypothetical protein